MTDKLLTREEVEEIGSSLLRALERDLGLACVHLEAVRVLRYTALTLMDKNEGLNAQLHGKYGLYDLQQRRMKGQIIRTELEKEHKALAAAEAELRAALEKIRPLAYHDRSGAKDWDTGKTTLEIVIAALTRPTNK